MSIQNLYTAVIRSTGNVSTFPGWFAPGETILTIFEVGDVAKTLANYKRETPNSAGHILSGSFHWEEKEVEIEPTEDDIYPTVRKEIKNFLVFSPAEDDKVYYRFIFTDDDKKISFSGDFDILLDTWTERYGCSDQYDRCVYAALPKHVPLCMDSRHCICVSPF